MMVAHLTLNFVAARTAVRIDQITDPDTEMMLMRLGMLPGDTIQVLSTIPNGAVVIEFNGQELALGQVFAMHIVTTLLTPSA